MLLVRQPAAPAITEETVLIVFGRGDVKLNPANCDIWADDGKTFDVAAMAARIFPGGHWLHLFAERPTEGSTTIVGDGSWLDAPGGRK